MKFFYRLIVVLLVSCVVFIFAGVLATWAPDKPVATLVARWAPPPSQFVMVQGMSVHVRDEGPRDDPMPLVLLHGTSASLHTWNGWTTALEAKHRVIRFDLPGFGLTGPNLHNDYSIGAYVQFVGAVMDALGVQRFALAGNSLGGQIAWSVAAAMPQRVAKLILVDAGGYPLNPESVPISFRIARMPGARLLMEQVLPRGVVTSSLRSVYGDPTKVTPELVDLYYDMALRTGNRQALAKRMDQLRSDDDARIKTLKVPTLILWGEKDRLIPVANGKRFAADIAGSRLVIFENLGHVPHEEDAGRTVKPVIEFLESS